MMKNTTTKLLLKVRLSHSQAEIAHTLGIDERIVNKWESGEVACPKYLDGVLRMHFRPQPVGEDFTFVDLFAGIGGIRRAFDKTGGRCVMTGEWNKFARQTYAANFANPPDHVSVGDITEVHADDVPDHDLLLAGFPCQPFSLAGVSKKNSLGRLHGFQDETQGTLFFDLARIIEAKRPKSFLLENVRNLLSHDGGRTFEVIRRTLEDELGYAISYRVMDASSWVPQARKRILIVGVDGELPAKAAFDFDLVKVPKAGPVMRTILHPQDGSQAAESPYTIGAKARVDARYTLTPHLWDYLREYAAKHRRAGNGFGYGLVGADDVARTLSARYSKDGSEILVDRPGQSIPRRLTPRECARLMGFPDSFVIPVSDAQAYKQFGNSVVVPMMSAVAEAMHPLLVEQVPARHDAA